MDTGEHASSAAHDEPLLGVRPLETGGQGSGTWPSRSDGRQGGGPVSDAPPRELSTSADWLESSWSWLRLVGNSGFWLSLALILQHVRGQQVWQSLFHRWARANLALGRFDCRVEGADRVAQPAILAPNHQSAFDIALLAAAVPPPVYFVARSDLMRVPVVRLILERGRHLVVRGKGVSHAHRILGQALERIHSGGRVVVFPEGTRSPSGVVRPFSPGAFRMAHVAGCPLIPVAIAGTRHVIPKGSRLITPRPLAISFLEPRAISARSAASKSYREQVQGQVRDEAHVLEALLRQSAR